MTQSKPMSGDRVRILSGHYAQQVSTVKDELAMMFTVIVDGSRGTVFLYYDPMKGDDWEYVT